MSKSRTGEPPSVSAAGREGREAGPKIWYLGTLSNRPFLRV